jgi:hypothetical protein
MGPTVRRNAWEMLGTALLGDARNESGLSLHLVLWNCQILVPEPLRLGVDQG